MRPAPGISIESQPEKVLFTMMLWGEARGMSHFGKLCVACTTQNIAKRYGTTLRETILKPKRFSSFNHDDPNLPKLLIGYKLEPEAWAACEAIVEVLPFVKDPTGGADHYYVCEGPGAVSPIWGRGSADWKEKLITDHTAFGACP